MYGLNSGNKGRRMCVAGWCKLTQVSIRSSWNSSTVDGLRAQLEEKSKRSNPSICALFCAFMEDFYLGKYRLMESVGVPVKRKEFERDFFPTIQTERPHGGNTCIGKT